MDKSFNRFARNFFLYISFLSTLLAIGEILVALTWVRHSSCKSSATLFYQGVQYFRVSRHWYGCQCLGFLTCTQMLMHAIAHGGCTDTVRASALEVDSGRKLPCHTGDSNSCQYCAWLFCRMLYQLSYLAALS